MHDNTTKTNSGLSWYITWKKLLAFHSIIHHLSKGWYAMELCIYLNSKYLGLRFFMFQCHYEEIGMVREFRLTKKSLACNMTLCFCASKLHSMGVGPSSAQYFVHDFIPYRRSVICLYLCMIWNRQSVWILTFSNRFG